MDERDDDQDEEQAICDEARRLHKEDRYDEALPLWRELTERWPHEGYFMFLSTCQAELERWPEAEESARAVLQRRPESWIFLRQLAQCLEAQGRVREAADAYECSLRKRDNHCTRVSYAHMLKMSGDVKGSREQLETCTRNFPEWEEAWFNLGCSWEHEDPERALRLMQTALEIDPEDGYYHARVAYMHGRLANVEEARHHLREARRLGSDHGCFGDCLDDVSSWLAKIDRRRHPRRHPRERSGER